MKVLITRDKSGVRFEFKLTRSVFSDTSEEVFQLACAIGKRLDPSAAASQARVRRDVRASCIRINNVDQGLVTQYVTSSEGASTSCLHMAFIVCSDCTTSVRNRLPTSKGDVQYVRMTGSPM